MPNGIGVTAETGVVKMTAAGQNGHDGAQGNHGGRGTEPDERKSRRKTEWKEETSPSEAEFDDVRARTTVEAWVEKHTPYRIEWWRSTMFEYWILRGKVIIAMTWVIICPRRFFIGIEWWFGPATDSASVRSDAQKGVGG